MTSSRATKPIKRERQRITRTACEPCREKRAKCDGEKPCGRCQTRSLDCHFTQRTWASKRSLQDEAASLREQLHRRERILDAVCVSDPSGDDVVRMLRERGSSYDNVYESVHGNGSDAGGIIHNTGMGHCSGQHRSGSCDCETCWSPATTNSNMLSSASDQSPFSFMGSTLTDDAMSQPSVIPDQIPQQQQQQQPRDSLQQQMNPMQSIPWATASDANSFGSMLDGTPNGPPLSTGVAADCPPVIDPMLWPPATSSDPLGQPFLNSWTGLMSDPTDFPKLKTDYPVMG